MIYICSWCGKELSPPTEGETISHGICIPCKERVLKEADIKRKGGRRITMFSEVKKKDQRCDVCLKMAFVTITHEEVSYHACLKCINKFPTITAIVEIAKEMIAGRLAMAQREAELMKTINASGGFKS